MSLCASPRAATRDNNYFLCDKNKASSPSSGPERFYFIFKVFTRSLRNDFFKFCVLKIARNMIHNKMFEETMKVYSHVL